MIWWRRAKEDRARAERRIVDMAKRLSRIEAMVEVAERAVARRKGSA